MTRIKSIITGLSVWIAISASAQKVGVVMSGGGAKGLYHIGVMKALEENGIPVDYVSVSYTHLPAGIQFCRIAGCAGRASAVRPQ